jgi:hypothetical protein
MRVNLEHAEATEVPPSSPDGTQTWRVQSSTTTHYSLLILLPIGAFTFKHSFKGAAKLAYSGILKYLDILPETNA